MNYNKDGPRQRAGSSGDPDDQFGDLLDLGGPQPRQNQRNPAGHDRDNAAAVDFTQPIYGDEDVDDLSEESKGADQIAPVGYTGQAGRMGDGPAQRRPQSPSSSNDSDSSGRGAGRRGFLQDTNAVDDDRLREMEKQMLIDLDSEGSQSDRTVGVEKKGEKGPELAEAGFYPGARPQDGESDDHDKEDEIGAEGNVLALQQKGTSQAFQAVLNDQTSDDQDEADVRDEIADGPRQANWFGDSNAGPDEQAIPYQRAKLASRDVIRRLDSVPEQAEAEARERAMRSSAFDSEAPDRLPTSSRGSGRSSSSRGDSELSGSDMQDDSEEDELGVNDKYFNFNDYKYAAPNLDDIEKPELMEELFPEQYKKPEKPLYSDLARLLNGEGDAMISQLNLEDDEELLGAFRDDEALLGKKEEEGLDMEFESLIEGQEIELAEIDLQAVNLEEKKDNIRESEKERRDGKLYKARGKKVDQVKRQTYRDLGRNEKKVLKKIRYKEEQSKKEFAHKTNVLKSSFNENISKLIRNVRVQRDTVSQSYGPLTLDNKRDARPIFEINREVDPAGYKQQQNLFKKQGSVPGILSINIRQLRCLKDKISPGYFIIKVSVLTRIGGSKLGYDTYDCAEQYKELSKNLRYFSKQKRAALDTEHREMDVEAQDGAQVTKAAVVTGLNFFQAKQHKARTGNSNLDEIKQRNQMMAQTLFRDTTRKDAKWATANQFQDTAVFHAEEGHEWVDLEKTHSEYRRFNSRYDDDSLEVNDVVNVLVPAKPETANVLQFELILLESSVVPRDYCVAWGVFPLLNSEFQVNEGKFKCPLLFGSVTHSFDKFTRIEEKMAADLDNWLCNLYFEVERVNLMDLQVDEKEDRLFFSPVNQLGRKGGKDKGEAGFDLDNTDIYPRENLRSGGSGGRPKTSESATGSGTGSDEDNGSSDFSGSVADSGDGEGRGAGGAFGGEDGGWEHVIDVSASKSDEEMDYDQYKFAVGLKYDLRTKNLTFKKITYILDEILADLRLSKWKTLNFQLDLVQLFFLWFLRGFTHYSGQYLACYFYGVPVTKFEAHFYKIKLEYASFIFMHELIVVAAGILFNSATFAAMVLLAVVAKNGCRCWPRVYYKIICFYGCYVLFDPILVLIVDIVSLDFEHGDWFKFYHYYQKKEGSGIVGIYMTIFIMVALTLFNGFLLYCYMIFVHMNGRILDLYKRLSGTSKTFFIPNDQEVSVRYLQWVMQRVRTSQKQDFIIRSEDKTVFDKVGTQHTVQFLQIYKIDKEGVLRKVRLFYKDFDGAINEIPQSKMRVSSTDAKQLFEEHESGGERKVLVCRPDVLAQFNEMKEKPYDDYSGTLSESRSAATGSRGGSRNVPRGELGSRGNFIQNTEHNEPGGRVPMGGIEDLAERDAFSASATPVARSQIVDGDLLRRAVQTQESQAALGSGDYMNIRDGSVLGGENENGSDQVLLAGLAEGSDKIRQFEDQGEDENIGTDNQEVSMQQIEDDELLAGNSRPSRYGRGFQDGQQEDEDDGLGALKELHNQFIQQPGKKTAVQALSKQIMKNQKQLRRPAPAGGRGTVNKSQDAVGGLGGTADQLSRGSRTVQGGSALASHNGQISQEDYTQQN